MPTRFPDDTQRLAIFGATGSGKTQAALWHLSHRRYDLMPWVIYNSKGDAAIDAIPYADHIEITQIPREPGVFIVHPMPDEQPLLEAHQREVFARGEMGVYVDEGYAMGTNNSAFRTLLMQGRSRRIPMIVLSQRPVWLDRYVFSESEFLQAFRLQHSDDRKAMERAMPGDLYRLPAYYSWYYDGLGDRLQRMSPVPNISVIHDTFARRLERTRATA